VKYFGAEAREADRYDRAMAGYEEAAIKTSISLAFLNFGQSADHHHRACDRDGHGGDGRAVGALTVGDFVMVNAYMIQITMPLNFLGTVYREIRQALVDMGEMFDLLEQPAEVADKPGAPALRVDGRRGPVRPCALRL
jgi:ABC-type transport system involved in Fe-S cluster assembly fused permease/ATPase subunit